MRVVLPHSRHAVQVRRRPPHPIPLTCPPPPSAPQAPPPAAHTAPPPISIPPPSSLFHLSSERSHPLLQLSATHSLPIPMPSPAYPLLLSHAGSQALTCPPPP